MASKDIISYVAVQLALNEAVSASTDADSVDTSEFEAVGVVTNASSFSGAAINLEFLQSDTDDINDAVPVDAERVPYAPAIDANGYFEANVVPSKRYLFVRYVPEAATSATLVSMVVKGESRNVPVRS